MRNGVTASRGADCAANRAALLQTVHNAIPATTVWHIASRRRRPARGLV